MTDDRLERALADAIADLAGTGSADYLDDILERTSRTRQRPWWTFPGRYTTMTPTPKFAAAAGLAFVLGLGVSPLIMPSGEGGSPSPASPSAPERSDGPAFPTGSLVSVESPNLLLTFKEDGTGEAQDAWMGWHASFIYATHEDLYTEMWNDAAVQAPVTYYWDFDGEHLTLSLWGHDPDGTRNSVYADNTWVHMEDPLAVVVASRDIEIGDPVYAMRVFVPADEAGPNAFTSTQDVFERIATVPIGKGQPITTDMLEPPTQ